ncbi:bifunctional DNA-formamidopyrimidine glycosylase/DNA-(apurinic or apyrimidinic site) lyase [Kineococcus gynurae]|uniref:Formamidopyrimidine-DNA glycosylase n=1 Tax=Kineococcus gynurae TaxID=452979 RepID=A0ABV5LVM7_9ACTN
MPELPEVEVVRRGVADHVVGRRIRQVEFLHPRVTRRHVPGPDDAARRCRDRVVGDAVRRGKYLWLPLVDAEGHAPDALVVHLGMSGQLLVEGAEAPDEKHLRARWTFDDDGAELRFVDQRTFGGLSLEPLLDVADGGPGGRGTTDEAPWSRTIPAAVAHIARDPLDPAFDDADFARRVRARSTGVKRALLDQGLVSGVGNIYADEALWRARLHYERPTGSLRRAQVDTLLAALREVMTAALDAGGTSFDALYVNVNGASGYFDRSLHAYGQAGRPCARCSTPIRRESFMNRSSFFCPRCQTRPRVGASTPAR